MHIYGNREISFGDTEKAIASVAANFYIAKIPSRAFYDFRLQAEWIARKSIRFRSYS